MTQTETKGKMSSQVGTRPGRRKRVLYGLFCLFLIIASVWIVRFRGTATLRESSGAIFGTTYHIKYEAAEPLDSEILEELERVDASLSVFNPRSCISRVNAGTSVKADAMLYQVLEKARQVSEATQGAFDVTVMPLVNAWGFGFKKGSMPTASQVDSLRQFVGYQKLTLQSDSTIRCVDPRVMIDCGAIAKGYGVDRVARVLREHGVRNFMVEIGGEVVTKGRNPEGHPWQIGVSKPTGNGDELQTVLSLENAAMATSGNYRNYYINGGRKYAHTIDPRTGRPVQHSLLSATVIAPDCATADAYATAFMVMGLEKARQVVESRKELKALFIYADARGGMRTLSVKMPGH